MIDINGLHKHRQRAHSKTHHVTKQELLIHCIANTGGCFSAEDTELILQGRAPQRDIAKVEYKAKVAEALTTTQASHRVDAASTARTSQILAVPDQPAGLHDQEHGEPLSDERGLANVHPADDRQKRRRTNHPPGWYALMQYGRIRDNSSQSYVGSSPSL